MKANVINLIIRLSGTIALAEGAFLMWFATTQLSPKLAPMGYAFAMLIAPPLMLVGARVLVKRLWAGVVLTLAYSFGALDLFSSRLRHGDFVDYLNLAVLLGLILTLTNQQQWIRRF